ncbi:MAG: DUF4065 domain-containing protein [Actinomycetaceae bacterium]|nr:DUF4065 domain-containing protein [Actinomycetaceae bacterium]
MANAREAVDYIRFHLGMELEETKMHKLLYYIQGWSLAWTGKPLFEQDIQAWALGPVVPSMRHYQAPALHPQQYDLSAEQIDIIESVVETYGGMSANKLVSLTHTESPWLDAWGDRGHDDKGNEPISHVAMRREFTRQAIQGKGPIHRKPEYKEIPDDKLERILDEACLNWDRTLRLLAQ